ncbi:MAG: nicotinamide mononucleotide transporter [Oscillospiraceae bacterium]|nr:nicotinamide mononucleotide transporter [Candidatus Limimonas egerieequi]
MNKVGNFLRAEFITGKSVKNWLFLAIGLLLQMVAIIYGYITGTPDGIVSIISAVAGIVSVVLCAEGKISFYIFGYIQLLTYTFGVAIPNHLYGEIYENIFYFATMIYGTYVWFKNYEITDDGGAKIVGKKLTRSGNIITYTAMIIGTAVLALVLSKTNDPVPFFDAITTVPAFIAQILLMLGYREQWVGWIVEDITSVVMFAILGNWVMLMMYIFWTINCIYGWYMWSKTVRDN